MPEKPPPSVDTISQPGAKPPAKKKKPTPSPKAQVQKRMKFVLMIIVGIPYAIYFCFCAFLLVILPDPAGGMLGLAKTGSMIAIAGAVFLLAVGGFLTLRVSKAVERPEKVRMMGMIRVAAFVIPGLLISAAVPFLVNREPGLTVNITEPARSADLVAPVAVTFSLEQAVDILAQRGLTAVEYDWDLNGDGEKDDTTVVPTTTAYFDREGGYNIYARIKMSDGSERVARSRLTIPKAVFSFLPLRPIVDEPITFSVAHLLTEENKLKEVEWDFDEDDMPDTVTKEADAVYTYHRIGSKKIKAKVLLTNNKQVSYERTVEVREPEPLPFPVTLKSEPELLLGPAPLGTIFRVETEEPTSEILWSFGDGEQASGERVGHTFDKIGNYLVTAEVRSETGGIARLSKMVQVVEKLRISDLRFDGSPEVKNDTLTGEVPVNVDLTPFTTLPLIEFSWEAPGASEVGSTDTTLQAIYRRPGTYKIILIGQDPDRRALHKTLTLEVIPPESMVTMHMTPTEGVAPLSVRFDASETVIQGKEISGFEWVFDEEEPPRRGGAQMEYLFEEPGTYDVTVYARTTGGESFPATRTIVVRAPPLTACFQPSRTEGQAPLGVSFDIECTTGEPESILWDFGDGSQSDEESPVHVFEKPGEYSVKLTLGGKAGTVSIDTITITVE